MARAATHLPVIPSWQNTVVKIPPPDPQYVSMNKGLGFIAFLSLPLSISALLFSGDYDYASAIGLIPLLLLINVVLVMVFSTRDPLLRQTMLGATAVKIAGAGLYLFMCYRVYDNGADALHYFTVGQGLANAFWSRGEWPLMFPLWSTSLVNTIVAHLILIVGPSMPALFVLFAFFSLWGGYFFYRAFCLIFPNGNRAAASVLLFFLPSIVLWTSSIGKDAIIALFLGIAAYGFALVRTRPGPRSYVVLSIGLAGAMAIRPHVAAMLSVAMVFPYLFAKNLRGIAGGVYKVAGLLILAAASVFLVSQAQDFLQMSDFKNATSVIERISNANREGGSGFGAGSSLPARVAMAPLLLFRPLPWEIHNPQSAVASLEGLTLLFLLWRRRNGLLQLVRGWRANPYVLFIVLYAGVFCVTFAAASSNFGTLSRMRVMLLPFAVMMLCGAPAVQRASASAVRAPQPRPYGRRAVTEPR